MKNIDIANPFIVITKNTSLGILTTLLADIEVNTKKSIVFKDKTLLASYVYKKDETYYIVYTIIDIDGNTESFIEEDGILPTLFLSPKQEIYVSLQAYNPNKDVEISIPIFDRQNIELPKSHKPFLGDFIGTSNQYSILFYEDIWDDKKNDTLQSIEFKNGTIINKHNIKIPLPRSNKVFISNNEIHLLASTDNAWLHRQVDALGNLVQVRVIKANQEYFWQIIKLSFTENSYILCEENGKILLEIISSNNECRTVKLLDIKDEFYNAWLPIKINENTFVTMFTSEHGNGWFTIKNEILLEFYYSKDQKGYKNLLNNEVLETEHENLVISSINKTKDNSYAVIFYPLTDQKTKNKKVMILNRKLY